LRFNDEVEARLASGAFYETIVLVAFYEIIKIVGIKIGGEICGKNSVFGSSWQRDSRNRASAEEK